MHPSFEDREDAADPVMARLDDEAYERQVLSWERALLEADVHGADVLHLHHLTPINEAAARVAPDVPVVGHLHGTELLMLEAIEDGADWPHAQAWAERMRGWATRCERIVLLSHSALDRAERLLGDRPGPLRRAAQRLRPRRLPPAPRRSCRPLAAPPRRRAAGLAAGGPRAASPTTRRRSSP